MGSIRVLGALVASLIVLGVSTAQARTFRPRIGGALGIVPPGTHQDIATGSNVPVVYHGGLVMSGRVRVHTVFWAPRGYRFNRSPGAGVLGYEALIQQYFVDAAHDSGRPSNVFSTLRQYPDKRASASYNIAYNPVTDSIVDRAPFPARGQQCASPSGTATCVTDLALERELNRVIQLHDRHGRGLHDLWLVFLPPSVDECIGAGACGTNAYAGYHSISNFGRGPVIYAVIVDPLIELAVSPGADPEGNPDAEAAIDTAAHEVAEAITDPEGTGWMDPTGFEVGDKCENGPQSGTPLGFAHGSPYNQVINGHPYLTQAMWSNANLSCRQSSSSDRSPLPLATVNLRQFSSLVSGTSRSVSAGISVTVTLLRGGLPVAVASGRTRAGGAWGPLSLGRYAAGDDRDTIVVRYGRGGPPPEMIATGSGGNPFSGSGWTGWFDLETGYAVNNRSVELAPCFQTGVLAITVEGAPTAPPVEQCQTETGIARVSTPPIAGKTLVTMSSQDNRAPSAATPDGALVKLTITLGEPGSVSNLGGGLTLLNPTGFPTCSVDLRTQTASCGGLVPDGRYSLTRGRGRAVRRARAAGDGTLSVGQFPGPRGLSGGDLLTLRNFAGRTLTVLHVAHLRVDIDAQRSAVTSGRCEPGQYWGPPITSVPLSLLGGPGVSGSGTACPANGDATGMPTNDIAQTDDRSGGQTRIDVPLIESTLPGDGATLYGPFTALAQAGLVPGARSGALGTQISVSITRAGSHRPARRITNVNTPQGVAVRGLAPGVYTAKWVLRDANGDTRTIVTRLVQEGQAR